MVFAAPVSSGNMILRNMHAKRKREEEFRKQLIQGTPITVCQHTSNPSRGPISTWCVHNLYPPNVIHRRKAERLGQNRFVENMKSSALCRLPGELLLEIVEYLKGADLLSLATSTRHLKSLLETKNRRGAAVSDDRKEFTRRLHRDDYHHLATAEESKAVSKLENLLCSFCYARHPKRYFDKAEIEVSPHTRKCFGSTGVFRVCEHRTVTLPELQQGPPTSPGDSVNICDKRHDRSSFHHGPQLQGMLEYTFSQSFALLKEHQFLPISRLQMRRALDELDEYICPHLRTSSWAVFHLLCKRIQQEVAAMHIDECIWPERVENAGMYLTAQCEGKNCCTEFGTYRAAYDPGILFTIWRDLGKLQDANGVKWLAQIENASGS